jgi:hypothetical protein
MIILRRGMCFILQNVRVAGSIQYRYFYENSRHTGRIVFRLCVRTSRRTIMANKNAKKALEQFKMQAASEVGVNLNQGYNGDLTSRQAGSIGGQMVKKMIESYENSLGAGSVK